MFTFRNLFPCGDSMVCIIDDREDVWKFAPNLITVKKYVYFQGIGDIHAPSAPREPPARKRGGWSPAIGECASLGPLSAVAAARLGLRLVLFGYLCFSVREVVWVCFVIPIVFTFSVTVLA